MPLVDRPVARAFVIRGVMVAAGYANAAVSVVRAARA
jgi:hypothetical protein